MTTSARFRILSFTLLSLALMSSALISQTSNSAPPAWGPDNATIKAAAPAPRLAMSAPAALSSLSVAEEGARDEIEAMKRWNRLGQRPMQNGFARAIPNRAEVRPMAKSHEAGILSLREGGDLVIGTSVEVAGAVRLRLRLSQVSLPKGAELWVYGADEERAFGLELLDPAGNLWTPSVGGDRIFLELRLKEDELELDHRFMVDQVLQTYESPEALGLSDKAPSCFVDGPCRPNAVPNMDIVRAAIGKMSFVTGAGSFVCTGSLLNDKDDSGFRPLFLTANHCISTQGAASSLETKFDFITNSCNGTEPGLGGLPTANGSTLLESRSVSDFTLLELSRLPGQRGLLGWSTDPVPNNNSVYHRLSHPFDSDVNRQIAQTYTKYRSSNQIQASEDSPRRNFIYGYMEEGGTLGGSSGSPILQGGAIVVGQLSGGTAPCANGSFDLDGRFETNFPFIEKILDPDGGNGGGGDTSPCNANGTTVCLVGDRFEVKSTFTNNQGSGDLRLEKHTDNTVLGFFTNSSNKEVIGKVLNGCSLNGNFWAFFGGVTDQKIEIRVRDTTNGNVWDYTSQRGNPFQTTADTGALPCN